MKYEKKYYDMAALQCEEICEELLREKARLTEEEWEAEAHRERKIYHRLSV